MVSLTADLGDIAQDLMDRVATLEQRITSPYFTVPNGGEPTFPTVNIGPWRTGEPVVPIQQLVSVPSGLTGVATTTYTDVAIDASWTAPADASAVQYQIDVATKDVNGNYSIIQSLTTTGTTAHISGLSPNVTYGIRVSGINAIGIVSAPTTWTDVATQGDSSLPAAPTNVRATAGMSSIMLTWNENTEPDVANGQGFYEVDYDTNAAFTTKTTVRVTGTVASFTGLTPGQTYYFRVRAFDSSNNPGPYSASAWAVVGDATGGGGGGTDGTAPSSSPTPVVQGAVGPALFVKFAMLVNSDPVTYEIHISTTNGFTPSSATKSTEVASSNVLVRTMPDGSALQYGVTYYVKIVAKDPDGSAPASGQASATPLQAGTNDIAVGAITATSGIIGSLDASKITTGTMSGNFITANTLSGDRIVAGTLDAGKITFGTMSGDRITANTLDISALKTSTLSARTITLASDGAIVGGSNPLGSGAAQTGFVLNGGAMTTYKGGATTFRLDFSTGNAFFAGDITGSTGTFSGTLTGATYQTSTTPTGDRIVIDAVNGLNIYREATTNYNTQPWFATVFSKVNYEAVPGQTGSIQSAWGVKYPNNADNWLDGTNVSVGTSNTNSATQASNPTGAPYMLVYTFPNTSPLPVAGAYQIYYDVAASAGQWWSTSMYMTTSNPTNNSVYGWTQFLDVNKNVIAQVGYTDVLTGGAATAYTAYTWKRNGATGQAPAGTAYVRQLIQAANLATAGAWAGAVYLTGAQIEQKDHHTAYCDGNQYGCTWANGNPNNISSRPYMTVTHLGIGLSGTGQNSINGSLFGGPADRAIVGYVATRDVQASQTYAFPYGGGVALGNVPRPGQSVHNPASQITFIPGDGIWQDFGDLPAIYTTDASTIGLGSTQQAGSGEEMPQALTLYSGYTYYGGSNRFATISVEAGSGASGNPYGGVITLSTSGEHAAGNGGYIQFNTGGIDVSYAPFDSPITLAPAAGSPGPAYGAANGIGDKIYLWSNQYGFGIQGSRTVAFVASTAVFAVQAGAYSTNTTSYRPVYASAFTVNSLRNTKENIQPFGQGFGLDKIRGLKPVKFRSKHFADDALLSGDPTKAERISFVAEDVEKVLPEVCSYEFERMDDEGFGAGDMRLVGIDLGAFAPVLVHAVQDLDAQLAALAARVAVLEKQGGPKK